MTQLRPGQILKEFQTKSDLKATLRILRQSDADDLQNYVNLLSAEDTYVAYSGEKVTLKDEEKFIKTSLENLKKGDAVPMVCEINGRIAAICRASRKMNMKKRSRHIAIIVISVKKEFRGEGIGKECMKEIIIQAKKIKGVNILKLTAFADNKPAISLYEKMGFKIVGRLPKQYLYRGKYQDNVIMQLEFGG